MGNLGASGVWPQLPVHSCDAWLIDIDTGPDFAWSLSREARPGARPGGEPQCGGDTQLLEKVDVLESLQYASIRPFTTRQISWP